MTSRKLIIFLLASMVMRNPLLLKMRHISNGYIYIYKIYIYIYIYSENKSSLPNDELPVRGSRGYVSLRKSVDRYNKTTKRQTLDSSSV